LDAIARGILPDFFDGANLKRGFHGPRL